MNQNRDLRLHKYETLENQDYASMDFDVDRELQRREIQNAILSMPLLQREILILRDIEELSYQEIAYVLSCPIGTVMSRIRRARLCFKDYFNKNMKRENAEL
jgi:RNA polymerase sigma-70 factor (ECF subfamily)